MLRRLFSNLLRRQQQYLKLQGQVTHSSTDVSETKQRSPVRLLLLSAGTGGLVYLAYRVAWKKDESKDGRVKNAGVKLYRKMPLKSMSRVWGKMTEVYLPVVLREPLLGLYVWMFSVNLEEAEVADLKCYTNLSEFFRRQLKPDARMVDTESPLTSPADGRILHYGKVKNGVVEQVKGVTYDIQGFLGPAPATKGSPVDGDASDSDDPGTMSDSEYQRSLHIRPGHSLYHCIIYLAPGDYHRFHSPTDWNIAHRRHFPGELLSVNPGVARWIKGLFNMNERVVYSGTWKYGFFSYTAVGATNVGSIRIYMDEDLQTNTKQKYPEKTYFDKAFCDEDKQCKTLVSKGDMLGEFNLGSTIVLIFEAPDNFKFSVKPGVKVKYGESLGTIGNHTSLIKKLRKTK